MPACLRPLYSRNLTVLLINNNFITILPYCCATDAVLKFIRISILSPLLAASILPGNIEAAYLSEQKFEIRNE